MVQFDSPRDSRASGIATVYQDLALVPLMSIWRNFFLGAEPLKESGRSAGSTSEARSGSSARS